MVGHKVHTIVIRRVAGAARVGHTISQGEFIGLGIKGIGPDRKGNQDSTEHK